MLTVRKAKIKDAEGIASIHTSGWKKTYNGIVDADYLSSLNFDDRVRKWEAKLRSEKNDQVVFVAIIDENIVGFLSGGAIQHKTQTYDCELYAIYVLDKFHNQGIGAKLFQHLTSWLSERDYKSLLVVVAKKNKYQGFYKKYGGSLTALQEKCHIGNTVLDLIAYSWPDVSELNKKLQENEK